IIIDDQDARITYSGQWSLAGSEMDFRHTLFSSQNSGASASFTFNGSSISVFGRVDNSSSGIVSASFSVDGSYPVSFANTAQSFVSYNKQFFQSRSLGAGVHKLNINSNSENPLWIDYL
ncbi:hypothetical protein K435DRAFT_581226, partial [Dendrothele bispora CBS 962.96]